jgi:hypothetical protein
MTNIIAIRIFTLFSQAEADEQILIVDFPDEALERAAMTEPKAVTWICGTNA